jgi:hypothetical protein
MRRFPQTGNAGDVRPAVAAILGCLLVASAAQPARAQEPQTERRIALRGIYAWTTNEDLHDPIGFGLDIQPGLPLNLEARWMWHARWVRVTPSVPCPAPGCVPLPILRHAAQGAVLLGWRFPLPTGDKVAMGFTPRVGIGLATEHGRYDGFDQSNTTGMLGGGAALDGAVPLTKSGRLGIEIVLFADYFAPPSGGTGPFHAGITTGGIEFSLLFRMGKRRPVVRR